MHAYPSLSSQFTSEKHISLAKTFQINCVQENEAKESLCPVNLLPNERTYNGLYDIPARVAMQYNNGDFNIC